MINMMAVRDLLLPGVMFAGNRTFPDRDTNLCRASTGEMIPRVDWELRLDPVGRVDLNIWHHDLPSIETVGHGAQTRLFLLVTREEIEDRSYRGLAMDRIRSAFQAIHDELAIAAIHAEETA